MSSHCLGYLHILEGCCTAVFPRMPVFEARLGQTDLPIPPVIRPDRRDEQAAGTGALMAGILPSLLELSGMLPSSVPLETKLRRVFPRVGQGSDMPMKFFEVRRTRVPSVCIQEFFFVAFAGIADVDFLRGLSRKTGCGVFRFLLRVNHAAGLRKA